MCGLLYGRVSLLEILFGLAQALHQLGYQAVEEDVESDLEERPERREWLVLPQYLPDSIVFLSCHLGPARDYYYVICQLCQR